MNNNAMKNITTITVALFIGIAANAQDKNVTSARLAMKDNDYVTAKDDINKAVNDPSTKESVKAWSTRGELYMLLQQDPKNKDSAYYKEAAKSYLKVLSLKPDYDKETTDRTLLACAYYYFNDGINAYNSKKYDDAYDLSQNVITIHNLDNGKTFAGNKSFDTVASQAKYVAANASYFSNKNDQALPLFEQMKGDNIIRKPTVYLYISDIYNKQNKPEDAFAAIEEGRKQFPDDPSLRNEELNYYIRTGKQDELMKKLEDATQKDPNNAELFFDLGNGYMGLAFPKDATGKDLPKPANYKDLISKTEASYQKAVTLSPDNPTYNYNLGVLYYNQATEINTQMNALGTNEQKRFDELKTIRNSTFDKALPYLEKSYNILNAKGSDLKGDDRETFHSTVIALKQIYAMQNKLDKATEMKKKLEGM